MKLTSLHTLIPFYNVSIIHHYKFHIASYHTAIQSQKAVTVHCKSTQLLPFGHAVTASTIIFLPSPLKISSPFELNKNYMIKKYICVHCIVQQKKCENTLIVKEYIFYIQFKSFSHAPLKELKDL